MFSVMERPERRQELAVTGRQMDSSFFIPPLIRPLEALPLSFRSSPQ